MLGTPALTISFKSKHRPIYCPYLVAEETEAFRYEEDSYQILLRVKFESF